MRYGPAMRLLFPCALLVGGLSLIGCSGSDAATPSGDSGGASGDAGPSGSGGSAGASDGGGEDSGTAPKSGFIGVTSRATEVATVFANSLGASFFDGPGNSFGRGCQREVIGKCAVVLCDYTNGGDQTPPPGPVESAGTLTVGGTAPTFSLDYDTRTMQYGAVPTVPTDKLLFAGGSTITFAAAGGAVPAFADRVVAPTPLTVTAPILPSGAFSFDGSADLVFVWTGSSVGNLAFNIRTVTSSGATAVSSSFVSCQFAASELTGTIPAVQLRKLRKTDATTTAILGTDLSSTKEVVAGDYSVHLAVGSVATRADGKTPYAASQVTIF